MKKFAAVLLAFLFITSTVFGYPDGGSGYKSKGAAGDVSVDTSGFSGNLNSLDKNVQHALNTLDALVISGSAWGGITGTLSSQTDLQNALNLKAPLISPSFTTPVLGTPSSGSLGSCTTTTQSQADNSTKLASTAYVDLAILGQNYKEACKYSSTAALPTVIYNSGAGTLTGFAVGAISLDGSSPVIADRILIKNQVSTFQNGIYTVTATGSGIAVFVLTRTSDANSSVKFKTGDSVFVTAGSTLSSTTWAYTGIDSPNFTSDAMTYAQIAGQGSFTGGTGITITGTSVAIDTSVTVDKTTSQTLTNKTLTSPTLTTPILGTPSSGNLASCTALPASSVTAGTFGTGAYTMDTSLTVPHVFNTPHAATVSSNAGTITRAYRDNTFTNSSAATMTITLSTTSAVDGDKLIVSIYDFSGVAQTIAWVNTEDSTVTASTTSNGSTTLPITDGFRYNGATSKWRCIAKA